MLKAIDSKLKGLLILCYYESKANIKGSADIRNTYNVKQRRVKAVNLIYISYA